MIINEAILMKALEWSYERALIGAGPVSSASDLAKEYLSKSSSKENAVDQLINLQVTKCATSGFITGLGGLITLPVAIPANISSVLLIQLRMIVAIAIMGGFDPKSEQVKSLAFMCLTGSAVSTILKDVGISEGQQVTARAVQNISEKVKVRINYLVRVSLFTKTGKIGFMKLGKIIPLVGGVIGGAIDAASTKRIGKAAKRVFVAP